MTKFAIVYTIEGCIEFDAETEDEARRKFEGLDQRELGELGLLLVHTDPPVGEFAKRELSDGSGEVVGTA